METTNVTRLLDAAEERFAAEGLDASLRSINTAAGLNPAAIHYHFGSREALLAAVVRRRQPTIAAMQTRLLDELAGRPPQEQLRGVVEALVLPLAAVVEQQGQAGRSYVRLLARLYVDQAPMLLDLLVADFGPTYVRLDEALWRALPHLPRHVLRLRRSWAAEQLLNALANQELTTQWATGTRGVAHEQYVHALIDQLVGALAAPHTATAEPRPTLISDP